MRVSSLFGDLSIKRRLTLVTILASSTALLAASAAFIGYEVVSFRQVLVRRKAIEAEVLAYNSASALVFQDQEAAAQTLAALKAAPRTIRAAIHTPEGRVFASYERPGAAAFPAEVAPPAEASGHRFEREKLVVTRPVLWDGAVIGGILLEADLQEIDERLRGYIAIVALVSLASFLVALLVASRLQRGISGPILSLADTARFVSINKDYSARAPTAGGAELGLLTRTFNEMLAEIQIRDLELNEARAELERRVDARTRDLKRSQVLLAEAQKLARLGNWEWDVVGNTLWWSDEMYRLHGLDPEQFEPTYQSALTRVHAEDREPFRQNVERALNSGLSLEFDCRIVRPDGSVRTLHLHVQVRLDETGKAVRLSGAAQDITERKRLEDERDSLFLLSQDLLCICGFDGVFRRANPAWENTLGYSNEEITRVPFMELVHPDDREATLAEFGKLLTGGTALSFENRYRCKDGSYRWLQWSAIPDLVRQVVYAIARDVTEQKAVQEDLRRTRDAAETANKELEAFSYSVSHDLRAPLRAIDGFSQALIEDYSAKLDAQGNAHLQRVRAGAQRMAQLIDDLLKLSRISRKELNPELLDISALARLVADELKAQRKDQVATIHVQEGLKAEADPRLLRVALENLFANAWKFTSKKPEPRIEFGATQDDGRLVYFVRDNGAGFDMAYAGKLFGAFQRLHSARDFEGTGIGLATVSRVIYRHGGRIWAKAAVDKGATFYFTLGERGAGQAEA